MKHLSHRRILASKFNDFLGNNTSEEGSHRCDGASRVCCNIAHNFFVYFLNCQLFAGLAFFVDLVCVCNAFLNIFSIITRKVFVLVPEFVNSSEGDVKLLRSLHAHVLHAWVFKETKWCGFCWVFKNFSKALKNHSAWNFDVLNDTLALICGKSSCILFNLEAERFTVSNFDGAERV